MKKTLPLSLLISCSLLYAATLEENLLENSLVVYNGSIALVHEKRMLDVKKNETQIVYEGVANTIQTDSINIKLPSSLTLYSQQFRFDKLTHAKLLEAHIDKSLFFKNEKEKQISATLLAYDLEKALVRTQEGKIISIATDTIIFETIPKELITKPSLVWNIATKKSVQAPIEIDYLIHNLDYVNNYIINIDKNTAVLHGWITIDNRSGKAFNNTQLHVLAGDIHRQAPTPYFAKRAIQADGLLDVQHHAHEGYHFYTIPFKVNIANQEKTQIKFLEQQDIQLKRNYTATMSYPLSLVGMREQAVSQSITLEAQKFVLPKGVVRTYSKLDNNTILLGENIIPHTAKNTPITLELGKNFDTKVEEQVVKIIQNEKYAQSTIEYTVCNNSDEPKSITVLVPFNKKSDSEVKSKKKFLYTKGNLVTFTTTLKPNKEESFEVTFLDMK
ncbi:MAG: hypothetical protein RBR59_06110 [Sulfurimonadaceae bacterium]|jgi:hypothetical protein|nr:hypothetical protein [Sulfurimonadaceae bacterium]